MFLLKNVWILADFLMDFIVDFLHKLRIFEYILYISLQ